MEKDRILVIDKDSALLHMVWEFMENTYRVQLAKSGEQALRYLQQCLKEKVSLPDLILLNVELGGMDGLEVLKQFRQMPGSEDIPVILTTESSDAEVEARGLASGAVDFIRKPFIRNVFVNRIALRIQMGKRLREMNLQNTTKVDEYDWEKTRSGLMMLGQTEQEVVKLLLEGYGNQEIGRKLNYSYGYVKQLTVKIYRKLEVKNKNQLREHFRVEQI